MNQIRSYVELLCIVGVLVSRVEARPSRQADSDDGGLDDAPQIIRNIETMPDLQIAPVKKIKHLQVPKDWSKKTVANQWIIKRLSELQAAVVGLRKSYEKVMRDHAAWSCRWMEAHFPEYFACVTKNYVDVVVDDCRDYPKGLLMTIRNVKELYMKSYVREIPIHTLNPSVFERTEYFVNGLLPAIEEHRRMLQDLAFGKLSAQTSTVSVICQLPAADRHPFVNTTEPDPTYVFEEDYSPVAYNRL